MRETVLQLLVAGIMGVERGLPILLWGTSITLAVVFMFHNNLLASIAASVLAVALPICVILFTSRRDGKRRG